MFLSNQNRLVQVIFGCRLTESEGQARRCVMQGGVTVDGSVVNNPLMVLTDGVHKIVVGKKNRREAEVEINSPYQEK